MKTKQIASLLIVLAMTIIAGCDAVGTNGDAATHVDLGNVPLYSESSPHLIFPLAPDTTIIYTADADTSGYE